MEIYRKHQKAIDLLSTAVCSQRIGIDKYQPDSDVYKNNYEAFLGDPDQRISEVQWHAVDEIGTLRFKMTNDKVMR